jgi:hypothetical protein
VRTRIVPPVLLAACIGAFVASGLHSGAQGVQPVPASVSEPETAVAQNTAVYYVDATISCERSKQKCFTETRKNADGTLHVTIRPATTP